MSIIVISILSGLGIILAFILGAVSEIVYCAMEQEDFLQAVEDFKKKWDIE